MCIAVMYIFDAANPRREIAKILQCRRERELKEREMDREKERQNEKK